MYRNINLCITISKFHEISISCLHFQISDEIFVQILFFRKISFCAIPVLKAR